MEFLKILRTRFAVSFIVSFVLTSLVLAPSLRIA